MLIVNVSRGKKLQKIFTLVNKSAYNLQEDNNI